MVLDNRSERRGADAHGISTGGQNLRMPERNRRRSMVRAGPVSGTGVSLAAVAGRRPQGGGEGKGEEVDVIFHEKTRCLYAGDFACRCNWRSDRFLLSISGESFGGSAVH